MFKISCFADEISADLNEQIEIVKKNNIKYIELRSVWNKNVLDLNKAELIEIKKQFSNNGIMVSSIGSPIGKIDIGCDFDKHLLDFRRIVETAIIMESPFIRVFSFYMKKNEMDQFETAVIDRMKQMMEITIENKIRLLHENEADIYGETSINCRKMISTLDNAAFRAVFDPANFVISGEDTLALSFMNLRDYIEYVHIKDSVKGTGKIAVAGAGDGHIKDILNGLRHKDGMFLSLEPHLAEAGKFRGFTGPELFEKDLEALRKILEVLGISYE